MEEFDQIGCRRLWVLVNGLPPDAAVFRVGGQQWTLRDEINAQILEAVDRWGWVSARLRVDPKHHRMLPDAPISVPRPRHDGEPDESPEEKQPEKDRHQLQRERIALFT